MLINGGSKMKGFINNNKKLVNEKISKLKNKKNFHILSAILGIFLHIKLQIFALSPLIGVIINVVALCLYQNIILNYNSSKAIINDLKNELKHLEELDVKPIDFHNLSKKQNTIKNLKEQLNLFYVQSQNKIKSRAISSALTIISALGMLINPILFGALSLVLHFANFSNMNKSLEEIKELSSLETEINNLQYDIEIIQNNSPIQRTRPVEQRISAPIQRTRTVEQRKSTPIQSRTVEKDIDYYLDFLEQIPKRGAPEKQYTKSRKYNNN